MPISWEWQNKMDALIRPYGKQRWSDVAREKARAALDGKTDVVVLEAGCGKDCWITRSLREQHPSMRVIGIDIDPDCVNNKDVDEAHVASMCDVPLKDSSVDLVVSGYVLEHLEEPEKALKEMNRVLKPGGTMIAWTPNRFSPLILLSLATPHWFHIACRKLTWGQSGADNAPTFYRANTVSRIRHLAKTAGFAVGHCSTHSSGYSYFRMAKLTYLLASVLNRLIMLLPLGFMKQTILCVLDKPQD